MPARKRKLHDSAGVQEQFSPLQSPVQQKTSPPAGGYKDEAEHQDQEELCSQYFAMTDENGARLRFNFFNQPCVDLAKAFLGKAPPAGTIMYLQESIVEDLIGKNNVLYVCWCEVLVRRHSDGTELRGKVVETEAYLGGDDKASHSAGGKRTERNTAMFMKPGTIYVYPIYGIYLCMNVSSQGEGAAVLLRSLEPLQGLDIMRRQRAAKRRAAARALKDRELCNGPSKLCQALDIQRCFDRRDLATDAEVWLEEDSDGKTPGTRDVVSAPRIGIESHGEWATKPLRFYLRGHPCVSVVNKEAKSKLEVTATSHQGDGRKDKKSAT